MPNTLYQIPIAINVVMQDGTELLNNFPLTRSTFNIVQGVTTVLSFFVRNIDRAPVALQTGQSFVLNLVEIDSQTLLLSRTLNVVDPAQGLYNVSILPSDVLQWPVGPLSYSVTVLNADTSQNALYTDMNYTPYGTCNVIPGPIPGPTQPITMDPSTFIITDGWATSPILPGSAFSGSVQTFTLYFDNFVGPIYIQGSLLAEPSTSISDWFQVSTQNYTTVQNGPVAITTQGNFVWLRIQVPVTDALLNTELMLPVFSGTVTQILYKN